MVYSPARNYRALPLDFLTTDEERRCPYLPHKISVNEFFWTEYIPAELYHDFMNHGFRRSGYLFYRPRCPDCIECRPLRVIAGEFRPTKSMRRVLRKNTDVEVRIGEPELTFEKARIYADYLKSQHNSLKDGTIEDLENFLYVSPTKTIEITYHIKGALAAVSIADVCGRSISSVYVYFDPYFSKRSLGVFSALHEINLCRDLSIPYYYMGYCVSNCPAMSYKSSYKPCELMAVNGIWGAAP